ncbi:MAG: YfiR family protein [Bacteroidota bacterium]|nr:YfiR family protein [Bacteroidota bacterium]
MLFKVKYLLVLAIALTFGFQQPNPSSYDTNAKIKAVFIYNFTKYFEWPNNKKTGNFIIYIVGKNDNLIIELNLLAKRKKVGSQDIEVKNTPAFDKSVNANMVFLLPESSKAINDVSGKSKNKGVLLITENSGGAKSGSSINFIIIDSKQKFEYSKNNAIKAGLKTNDDFKSLAINVD